MSQQSLNVRQVVRIVRRYRILVGALTAAGLLIGAAYSVVEGPLMTSTALVVFPATASATTTEAVIADSEPVLSAALPAIHPPMSLQTLENQLTVQTPAVGVLSISVKGKSAAQAEGAANAVAKSYLAEVGPRSPVGHVYAELLQPATMATGMGALEQDALDGGIGALVGLLAGTVTAIVVSRRSRRLVVVDDIADSIGVPVLAAVSVGLPAEAAGWARLIDEYEPTAVDAWRLRQALLDLEIIGPAQGQGAVSVTVLSMSADPKALALGPQLAAFAASLEIPTLLIIGSQDSNETAALFAACTAPGGSLTRSRYLRTVVAGTTDAVVRAAEKLVVVVAVGEKPQVPGTTPMGTTVLGVSSGAATAEQVARLAMAAAAHGGEVTGFLVADPDPTDRINGRLRRPVRQERHTPAPAMPSAPRSEPGPVPERGSGPVREEDVRLDLPVGGSVPTEDRAQSRLRDRR